MQQTRIVKLHFSCNVWVQLDLPPSLDLDCSPDFIHSSSRYSKCYNDAVIQVKDA